MSGVVANIKRCKNIYDANIGLNMIRCPYCFQEQSFLFQAMIGQSLVFHAGLF